MDEKRFRFDLFIALCALLVSSVAAGASAYQTYVISQQYQASIWPYLGFSFSSGTKNLQITLKNYGLGPALVRYVSLTKDGKEVPSFSSRSPLHAGSGVRGRQFHDHRARHDHTGRREFVTRRRNRSGQTSEGRRQL
jgi:hypothetical protein